MSTAPIRLISSRRSTRPLVPTLLLPVSLPRIPMRASSPPVVPSSASSSSPPLMFGDTSASELMVESTSSLILSSAIFSPRVLPVRPLVRRLSLPSRRLRSAVRFVPLLSTSSSFLRPRSSRRTPSIPAGSMDLSRKRVFTSRSPSTMLSSVLPSSRLMSTSRRKLLLLLNRSRRDRYPPPVFPESPLSTSRLPTRTPSTHSTLSLLPPMSIASPSMATRSMFLSL
mmetsp:Transcript_19307/g.42016  ORF Transcript_19307/g.42016 Transcript_19307/m.42016 type:complete len:226 (-) Transcript_19307:2033-2710(-)